MLTPDLTYRTAGFFTHFYPETTAGRTAWDVIRKEGRAHDDARIFTLFLSDTLQQIRAAGYTVTKAQPVTMTDDELLAQLIFPEQEPYSPLHDPDTLEVYP
jgi:hypothetical protein